MGKKRHYYDKHGNYKGHSSDKGPYDWLGYLVLILIVLGLLKGC